MIIIISLFPPLSPVLLQPREIGFSRIEWAITKPEKVLTERVGS